MDQSRTVPKFLNGLFPGLVRIAATFFYIGYVPVGPGTAASAAGALLSIALSDQPFAYLVTLAVILLIGLHASGQMEEMEKEHDPGCVVIDEVAGAMIAFFMLPLTLPVLITAFFLFRAFDMFKVFPSNRFERLKGGMGIMADDIIAGFYANILMHVVLRFIHF